MSESRICIGLQNPKSASNVAAILRAAGCFGVQAIFYTGERYSYAKGFNQDTQNMRQQIATVAVDDLLAMKPNGASAVAIELVEDAVPLPNFTHPQNAYYVFGPEDGSLSQSLVSKCDHVVYVPTFSSLNLAVSANVVLYDRLAKSDYPQGNQLIKQSRDNNNQLRV